MLVKNRMLVGQVNSHLKRIAGRPLQICRAESFMLYVSALSIFAASRIVVILGVNFGPMLAESSDRYVRTLSAGCEEAPHSYSHLLNWDSVWFFRIITFGYSFTDDSSVQSSVAFFPLYPLTSYGLKSILGIDAHLALFMISNLSSLLLLLLLTKFIKDELGERVSLLTVALFFFFPSSLFLSAGYSESLTLVLIVLSFILLSRRKIILGALAGGLSVVAHARSIALAPVIVWVAWHQSKHLRLCSRIVICALSGLLAVLGVLAYMLYLDITFHRPLAFASAGNAWVSGTLLSRFIFSATLGPFQHFDPSRGGWFVCALVLTILSFWRLRFEFSMYGLLTLAVPYFSLGITDSMNRFVLLCVPAFVFLAWLCRERPLLAAALVGIFAAVLFRNTALFSQCYWIA